MARFDAAHFDERYYARYYDDPRTRVASPEDVARRAGFIASYLAMLEVHVDSILDLGAGNGWWRDALAVHYPDASYTGVELSTAACAEHGWIEASIDRYDPEEPADLVLCVGVLQYLDAGAARRALRNLARATESALFLEALTREDWDDICDQEKTDGAVYLRGAEWYRRQLRTHFIGCGGGLFAARDAELPLYALERV